MSSDCDTGRYVTWKFSHILHTSLDVRASRSLAIDSISSYDAVKQLFKSLIMTNGCPHQVAFIQLRVPRTMFEACVLTARAQTRLPDLPFEGYSQAPGQIDRKSLMPWFDATWERVRGKLNAHKPCLTGFLAPDEDTSAAFVYFHMLGEPALRKGGRPRKPPAVNYSSACLNN
jgi:hypothetical protein